MHQNSKYLVLISFLVYPVYTLPWIIKSMIKNEYFGYILFSFLMGYFAYLMIPYANYDLVRHFDVFERLSNTELIYLAYNEDKRFFFSLYMWLISHLGLPREFVPFSSVFIVYLLLLLTLKKIIESELDRKRPVKKHIMTVIIFLLLSETAFINSASGMRNYIAISLLIYGVFDYYLYKKLATALPFIVLSVLFHVSMIPLVFIFLFSILINKNKFFKIVFIASFLLLISGQIIPVYLVFIKFIGPTLSSYGLYIDSYLTGSLGTNYYDGKRSSDIIMEKVLLTIPFYLAGFYLLLIKNIQLPRMQSFVYMVYAFTVLTSPSRTLFLRYSYFFILVFIFIFALDLASNQLTRSKKILLSILIISLISINLGRAYANRSLVLTSWVKTLYTPALISLFIDRSDDEYIQGN